MTRLEYSISLVLLKSLSEMSKPEMAELELGNRTLVVNPSIFDFDYSNGWKVAAKYYF